MSLFDRVHNLTESQKSNTRVLSEAEVNQFRLWGPRDVAHNLEDVQTGLRRWLTDRKRGREGEGHGKLSEPISKLETKLAEAVAAAHALDAAFEKNYL